MTAARKELQLLRDLEKAREKVQQWEMTRFWVCFSIVISALTLGSAMALTVLGILSDAGQVAMFVPSSLSLAGGIGVYFLFRWLAWTEPASYGREGTDGPYDQLSDAQFEYDVYLTEQAARNS